MSQHPVMDIWYFQSNRNLYEPLRHSVIYRLPLSGLREYGKQSLNSYLTTEEPPSHLAQRTICKEFACDLTAYLIGNIKPNEVKGWRTAMCITISIWPKAFWLQLCTLEIRERLRHYPWWHTSSSSRNSSYQSTKSGGGWVYLKYTWHKCIFIGKCCGQTKKYASSKLTMYQDLNYHLI